MTKPRSFLKIVLPAATVFISSSCIMVLELVAARLIARHLGSSLYTWTAVIGVVLAGITIGNYLGGRIADKFNSRKALAILFAISSASCISTIVLNNLVGEWIWLWKFSWPARTFTHVSLVFLLPSLLLGTISPVVAKMALDQGLAKGRTVGDIYAAGAAGSIAGTFAAGYYLIAMMGTIAIIWTIGAVLLALAILFWIRFWPLYICALLFVSALLMGTAPTQWAEKNGAALSLRGKPNPNIIYEDESQYCHIAVKQVSKNPDRRFFIQDKLKHSEIIMDNINNLQYFHTIIFAAITHSVTPKKDKLSAFHIGGGGYVFPRYLQKNWPGSRNDVAEIDPKVTRAAKEAFGLEPDSPINTYTMDARNYIDEILEKEKKGNPSKKYDFIYEDAFNDYSVPFQLVTREFNDKVFDILDEDGIYMINCIGSPSSGKFVGSYLNTLKKTFPYVYAIGESGPQFNRQQFVLIASKQMLNPEKYVKQRLTNEYWYLSKSDIKELIKKANSLVLTDNYAPVENLLAPVVRQSAVDFLSGKLRKQAEELENQGKLDEAIAKYREIINTNETMSTLAFNEIGMMKTKQGNFNEAANAFRQAIRYNEKSKSKVNLAAIHLNLAFLLKNELKQHKKAEKHFNKAIEGFKKELAKNPKSIKTVIRLARTLVQIKDFKQATEYFQKAVDLNPYDLSNHYALSRVLVSQGRYKEAARALRKAIGFMNYLGREKDAEKLKRYLELSEFRKSKQNQ